MFDVSRLVSLLVSSLLRFLSWFRFFSLVQNPLLPALRLLLVQKSSALFDASMASLLLASSLDSSWRPTTQCYFSRHRRYPPSPDFPYFPFSMISVFLSVIEIILRIVLFCVLCNFSFCLFAPKSPPHADELVMTIDINICACTIPLPLGFFFHIPFRICCFECERVVWCKNIRHCFVAQLLSDIQLCEGKLWYSDMHGHSRGH